MNNSMFHVHDLSFASLFMDIQLRLYMNMISILYWSLRIFKLYATNVNITTTILHVKYCHFIKVYIICIGRTAIWFSVIYSTSLKFQFFSSPFTDSRKYENYFMDCFQLPNKRHGEICYVCVLSVKRYKRRPAGSDRHWDHVSLICLYHSLAFVMICQ